MAVAIQQLGISQVTFYRWHKEYGWLSGDPLGRLKQLEKESELFVAGQLCQGIWERQLIINAPSPCSLA